MTLSKFTEAPGGKEISDKINDIIDAMSGGGQIVDQIYDSTSANAQSGVAIGGAGFFQNKGNITSSTNLLNLDEGIYLVNGVAHTGFPDGGDNAFYGILVQYGGSYKPQLLVAGPPSEGGLYYRRYIQNSSSFSLWEYPITNIKTINSNNIVGTGDIQVGTVTSVNNISPSGGNITLSIPTDTGDLTNGAGFITGINSSDVTTALGFTPYNSTNPSGFITSSALLPYQLISQDVNILATSGTINLTDNTINSITPTASVSFTLPTVSDNTKFHQILVQVNLSTVYSIDLGLGNTPHFFNKTTPDMSTTGVYNLIYEYDKANQYWVAGIISKGTAS